MPSVVYIFWFSFLFYLYTKSYYQIIAVFFPMFVHFHEKANMHRTTWPSIRYYYCNFQELLQCFSSSSGESILASFPLLQYLGMISLHFLNKYFSCSSDVCLAYCWSRWFSWYHFMLIYLHVQKMKTKIRVCSVKW